MRKIHRKTFFALQFPFKMEEEEKDKLALGIYVQEQFVFKRSLCEPCFWRTDVEMEEVVVEEVVVVVVVVLEVET